MAAITIFWYCAINANYAIIIIYANKWENDEVDNFFFFFFAPKEAYPIARQLENNGEKRWVCVKQRLWSLSSMDLPGTL